ncbi:MAG TPA: antibiotic biosynthesis monooxygenase [Thermomicrobiales bacterium]|nr:antibiotic biosynthesis monooxygenase [Thermomicrobiales bacterium]
MSQPLARITSMMLQPESIDLAFDHFRNASAPLVRVQAGSLGIIGAGNRETGFGCAISFWDTRESLERSNAEPKVVEAMGGYAKWMAGPFRVESYTVHNGEPPEPNDAHRRGTWLRTTWVLTSPERRDDALSVYEARLEAARSSSPACVGTQLLAPQIGSRILAIEHWTSLSALNAWNAEASVEDQRLFRAGRVDESPERDTLEVFGLY